MTHKPTVEDEPIAMILMRSLALRRAVAQGRGAPKEKAPVRGRQASASKGLTGASANETSEAAIDSAAARQATHAQ